MRKKEGASGDSIPASVAFRLYCQDVLAEIKEVGIIAKSRVCANL